jgi:hypothetical protein
MSRYGSVSLRILCAAASVLACRAADHATPNALTAEESHSGWTLLFDGKTMNGWVDPRLKTPPGDAWTLEDGCLKAKASPRITEDLFTKDPFGDFELVFDWRLSAGGNSGVKYRIQEHLFLTPQGQNAKKESFEQSVEQSYRNRVLHRPDRGQDYVIGFEYQIIDGATYNGERISPKQTAGALYDMVAPSKAAALPVGEFNHSRILLVGNHVEHWLNDVKVVDSALDAPEALQGIKMRWGIAPHIYELLAAQPKKECLISLQNHGNDAWFRSIKVRRLTSK